MTAQDAPTLAKWLAEFETIEKCPWPGPRPLDTLSNPAQLKGRDDDLDLLHHEVATHRLVFLTGDSGTGKTSLLRRGLVPLLEANGYEVAVCRNWSGAATTTNAAGFISNSVRAALSKKDPEIAAAPAVLPEFEAKYGARAVLVLDQFEELMRDAPSFTTQMFKSLGELNHRSQIRVIISLRSEHLHQLRPLEHVAQPYTMSHVFLEAMDPKHAKLVVESGNTVRLTSVDVDAAKFIAEAWQQAVGATASGRDFESISIGLLHLQALLYTLWAGAGETGITMELFEGFCRDELEGDEAAHLLEALSSGKRGREAVMRKLFTKALAESVEVKLGHCQDAALNVGLDRSLIEGTSATLGRSVRHLSSAGYKLVRDPLDLAEATLGPELAMLSRGLAATRAARGADVVDGVCSDNQIPALITALLVGLGEEGASGDTGLDSAQGPALDIVGSSRADVAEYADRIAEGAVALPWTARLHPGLAPGLADPEEVTSGVMMGMAPAAVMIEVCRRFALALEWLRASDIVRISSTGRGEMRVALIHDGFGSALHQWSDWRNQDPAVVLSSITAQGGQFGWPAPNEYRPQLCAGDEEPAARVLANLRWRGSSVIATGFHRTVFANCDFRGAIFLRCRFEGVVFLNCLLDGAMFSDCSFVGAVSPIPTTWEDEPTEFRIPGSSEVAKLLAFYRGDGIEPREVLVRKPGLPSAVSDATTTVRLALPETGSAVVIGGRVSTLMFRNNSFFDGAHMAFREVAGSGLDVVEHTSEGSYEISGSSIRHVAFSAATDEGEKIEPITIDVIGSALFQVWIGGNLTGSLNVKNSQLLSIWNGTTSGAFAAHVSEGSIFHDLVGVDYDTSEPFVANEISRTLAELDPGGTLMKISAGMDYRRSFNWTGEPKRLGAVPKESRRPDPV